MYWAPSSIGAALAAAGPDVAPAQRTPSSASAPNHRQRPGMLHFIFNGPPLTAARILEAQVAQVKRYYTPYPIRAAGAPVREVTSAAHGAARVDTGDAALDIETGVWDLATVWE